MTSSTPVSWRADANCKGLDINEFFRPGPMPQHLRDVCESCTVGVECLTYAIDHDLDGCWGATSKPERRAMRRRLNLVAVPVPHPDLAATPSSVSLAKREACCA